MHKRVANSESYRIFIIDSELHDSFLSDVIIARISPNKSNHRLLVLLSYRTFCSFLLSVISLNIQICPQNFDTNQFYSSVVNKLVEFFDSHSPFNTKSTFQMRFDKFIFVVVFFAVIVTLSEVAICMQQKFFFF